MAERRRRRSPRRRSPHEAHGREWSPAAARPPHARQPKREHRSHRRRTRRDHGHRHQALPRQGPRRPRRWPLSERRTILTIAGRDKTKLIDGVERQIASIQTVLHDHGGPIGIRGALCFADVDGLPLFRHLTIRNIIIDGTRTTAKLATRPGPLTPDHVNSLWQHLAQQLPPA